MAAAPFDPASPPRGQHPRLWRSLLKALSEGPGDRQARPTVLDCGGGSGSMAVALARLGVHVTVVDVSIDALSTLLRRAAEAGVEDFITAEQGDVEGLAELVGNRRFDLVLAHGLLQDVADEQAALGQLRLAVAPSGAVSVVVGNPAAAVVARLLAGDIDAALAALRRMGPDAATDRPADRYAAAGLRIDTVDGLGMFADFIARSESEVLPAAAAALQTLEAEAAGRSPFRELAPRLHIMARPVDAAGPAGED